MRPVIGQNEASEPIKEHRVDSQSRSWSGLERAARVRGHPLGAGGRGLGTAPCHLAAYVPGSGAEAPSSQTRVTTGPKWGFGGVGHRKDQEGVGWGAGGSLADTSRAG